MIYIAYKYFGVVKKKINGLDDARVKGHMVIF